ncbi:MAG: four-carbon acid sugar kinase family protein [Candidatus Gastranaerophilales bacterium]|nr:four-carbon acid sugar kinase family protein [Candidatus Gastranaerophilales bacterium]
MVLQAESIGIIADDLTGANDTGLQFHLKGCNTQILFDATGEYNNKFSQAWAISTETRSMPADKAFEKTYDVTKNILNNLKAEHIYKKIDSTLRGNIAVEVLAVLEATDYDAAIILPAFPQEGRVTIGGYHLLRGMPLERTEFARDLRSPIFESHIPTLLQSQIEDADLVGLIEFKTVSKGAGPIIRELHALVEEGKKLIVVDSMSTTDMEQVSLALRKSNYNILPCGSAGLAQVLAEEWFPDLNYQHIAKTIPDMPILVVSGSATDITKTQMLKLEEEEDLDPYFIKVTPDKLLDELYEDLTERILNNLGKNNTVVLQASPLENEQVKEFLAEKGLTAEKIPGLLTDYLADLTRKVVAQKDVVLVLVGGETSYKCCNAISSRNLQIIDEVEPAIPLCMDHKAQWIVTKSGNLGNPKTLVNLLRYFEQHV